MSRILFFGSDSVSHTSLKTMVSLNRSFQERVQVLCPPMPKHLKYPLGQFHQYLDQNDINKFFLNNFRKAEGQRHSDEWYNLKMKIAQMEKPFDVGIISSFGHMIPDEIIDLFSEGMFVMHPSLLPAYRGACPIQHAILNRDPFSGSTVIEIAKGKFDTGNILKHSAHVPITPDTRFSQLSEELSVKGGELLAEIFESKESLNQFKQKAIKQSECKEYKASKAPFLKPNFGELKFDELSAREVQARFNALDGSNTRPKAVFNFSLDLSNLDAPFMQKFDGQNVYFRGLYPVEDCGEKASMLLEMLSAFDNANPGAVVWNHRVEKHKIFIKCKDKTWSYFEDITLAGLGKLTASQLVTRVLQNQISRPQFNPKTGVPEFVFNFI